MDGRESESYIINYSDLSRGEIRITNKPVENIIYLFADESSQSQKFSVNTV